MIEIIDDFLPLTQCKQVVEYCYKAPYYYGEVDVANSPNEPTGMVNDIGNVTEIYKLFEESTQHLFPDLKLVRMYVNCFSPGEQPYFHLDSDEITFLYYVPTAKWSFDDGGETQFFMDKEIRGVVPIPNRMVYFDANILHRATSFRNRHRFTVAIKYGV
jgi:hypothetical protein